VDCTVSTVAEDIIGGILSFRYNANFHTIGNHDRDTLQGNISLCKFSVIPECKCSTQISPAEKIKVMTESTIEQKAV